MEELTIRVIEVSKSFKALKAVKDLSFQVEKAECFGLLGPNGAGKSTMMNMVYGKTRRDNPQPGQLNVLGYDPLTHELAIKYLSGIVPQENNLDLELEVLQNLLIYARFYGLSRRVSLPRIERLLEFMELGDKKKARIRELSGGMKRRLVIARALLNEPRLLILDEPTTGLDPQVRQLIWDKLRLLKKDGVTILLTTHYMEEAFQLCDRLIIMHSGEKVLEGRPADLIQEYMEPYVLEIFNQDSLGGINLPPGVRMEATGSRVLLYSPDLSGLEGIGSRFGAGNYFLRQSNLEDLFLKTTGRQLNE